MADPVEHESDPLERVLANELKRWQSRTQPERAALLQSSPLASSIEFYLCGAFKLSETSRGWWCDGVEQLTIEELNPSILRVVGAAYWAKECRSPFWVAPFELEIEFGMETGNVPECIRIRFGEDDGDGGIRLHAVNADFYRIVAQRPRRNCDWALAIELTDQA